MAFIHTYSSTLTINSLHLFEIDQPDRPLQDSPLRYYLWKQIEIALDHFKWNVSDLILILILVFDLDVLMHRMK